MRRRTPPLALLAVILLSVGCAAKTPRARWAQQRDTLTRVQDTIGVAHDFGLIDDREIVKAGAWSQAARRALDDAETRLPDGGATFDMLLGIAGNYLEHMHALEQSANGGQ